MPKSWTFKKKKNSIVKSSTSEEFSNITPQNHEKCLLNRRKSDITPSTNSSIEKVVEISKKVSKKLCLEEKSETRAFKEVIAIQKSPVLQSLTNYNEHKRKSSENLGIQPNKKLKKSLSMKKSSETVLENDDIVIPEKIFKKTESELYIKLHPIEISTHDDSFTDIFPITDCINTENDDDAFISTPTSEICQEITDLEKIIKIKREKYEKLKQAEVYKKKHDVNNITNETHVWLKGCANGLEDLLRKVQETSSKDMLTLMQELKIPSDITNRLQNVLNNI